MLHIIIRWSAKYLKKEKVDLLLLATDAIIYKKILEIPSLATLNAHQVGYPNFEDWDLLSFNLKRIFSCGFSS